MKSTLGIGMSMCLTIGLTSFAWSSERVFTEGPSKEVEVNIDGVLAPPQGFDDNDNVQVVVYGMLPNSCYRIDQTKVEALNSQKNKLKIRQYAIKRTDGVCAEENMLPEHLQSMVPFTQEVFLGALASGDYEIKFDPAQGNTNTRRLTISKARKLTVDDLSYAAVTNVSVSDVVKKSDRLEATVSGFLTSTCAYLDPNPQVKKYDDVYVVLPTVKTKLGVYCAQSLIPFMTTIDLGYPQTVGHSLVHVRSMQGKAVNRVIQVQE